MKFTVAVPPGTIYAPPEVSRGLSVSPDGTRLVIEAYSKGRRRLFVRPLDSEEATELEGSLDATGAFLVPGQPVHRVLCRGKAQEDPGNGGPPVELCDAPFALVGTWNREGTILFSNFNPPGIFRVSDTGGEAVRVAGARRFAAGSVSHLASFPAGRTEVPLHRQHAIPGLARRGAQRRIARFEGESGSWAT